MEMREPAAAGERNITVKLSDAACEQLLARCGIYGLTVNEVVTDFLLDLLGGADHTGSSERNFAKEWSRRSGFYLFTENTLLRHLLEHGYDPEEYLDILSSIAEAQKERAYLKEHFEGIGEELQDIDLDIDAWEEILKGMRKGWKKEKRSLKGEIDILRQWVQEREDFVNSGRTVKIKGRKKGTVGHEIH